jgi:queuosine biosynthesis protein QueD
MLLRKTFRFEASHVLPKHPGKCSRLHGHSWVLHVFVEGKVNPDTGFVMDYADISKAVEPLIRLLDHTHLGVHHIDFEPEAMPFAVPPSWRCQPIQHDFYPTSENLLIWIGRQLTNIRWSKLALEETCTSYAEVSREEVTQKGDPSC